MISPSRTRTLVFTSALLLGCGRSPSTGGRAPNTDENTSASPSRPYDVATATASADGLILTWELGSAVVLDRVPLRTVKLRFRNTGKQTLRFYLPQSEPFRSQISDVAFTSSSGARFFEPEPHPHGYVVSEIDFPAIAPGEEKVFTQSFTLDPFGPGGAATARRRGFEKGTTVAVVWTYQNRGTEWKGGARTLDGVTQPLFGGRPIPGLWTGKLEVAGTWIVPD